MNNLTVVLIVENGERGLGVYRIDALIIIN